jgi:farnesyl diphosphate synthase
MLDLTSNPQGQWDPALLGTFNLDVYKRIVRYKTAYYSFYLPVASAMVLCGTTAPQQLATVQDICVEIGEKFQIQVCVAVAATQCVCMSIESHSHIV